MTLLIILLLGIAFEYVIAPRLIHVSRKEYDATITALKGEIAKLKARL